jgi:hypothetical protein
MHTKLSPVKSKTTHIHSHYLPKIPAGLKKTYYAMNSVLQYISALLKKNYCTKVRTSLDYLSIQLPRTVQLKDPWWGSMDHFRVWQHHS